MSSAQVTETIITIGHPSPSNEQLQVNRLKSPQENRRQEQEARSPSPGDATRKVHTQQQGKKSFLQRMKDIVEWSSFVIIVSWLVATLSTPKLENIVLWDLEMWKWCVLTLSIFCGRLVSSWVIRLTLYFVQKFSLWDDEILYYAKGLRQSVQVFIWLVIVLLIWLLLLDGSFNESRFSGHVPDFLTRTFGSLIIGAFLWILKRSLLIFLKSKFNINAFLDKILDAIVSVGLLKKLSGEDDERNANKASRENDLHRGRTSLLQIPAMLKEISEERHGKKNIIDRTEMMSMKKMREIPPWTTDKLIKMLLDLQLHLKSDEDFDYYAEHAAQRIIENLAPKSHENIWKDDLRKFLSHDQMDDLRFFEVLDAGPDEMATKEFVEVKVEEKHLEIQSQRAGVIPTERVKKQTLKNWAIQTYDDHRELACILKHIRNAVHDLDKILTPFLVVVTLIIWVLLARIATTKVLLFISSQLLLAAFMFGNTLKTVFESIIFVFVMHPFNLGDRCVVDGIQMTVVEMNIFTTVFLKLNEEKVYYPNSVLATKPISNYYRSPDMTDAVELLVETTTDTVDLVRKEIYKYLEANLADWHPSYELLAKENELGNKIKLVLCCKHKKNFQNFKQKNRRRTKLVIELKRILEKIQQQKEKEKEKMEGESDQPKPTPPPAPVIQLVHEKSANSTIVARDAPLGKT